MKKMVSGGISAQRWSTLICLILLSVFILPFHKVRAEAITTHRIFEDPNFSENASLATHFGGQVTGGKYEILSRSLIPENSIIPVDLKYVSYDGGLDLTICVQPFVSVNKTVIYEAVDQDDFLARSYIGLTSSDSKRLGDRIRKITYHGYWKFPESERSYKRYATVSKMALAELGYRFGDMKLPEFIKYRDETNASIARSEIVPSFNGSTLNVAPGQSIDLTDTSKVLRDFMKYEGFKPNISKIVSGLSMTWDGEDNISIKPEVGFRGKTSLRFLNGAPAKPSRTYYAHTSQARFSVEGIPEPAVLSLNINSTLQEGFLELHKKGPVINTVKSSEVKIEDKSYEIFDIQTENLYLGGAEFDLIADEKIQAVDRSYEKGEKIAHFVTHEEGAVKSNLLPAGHYLLREVKAPLGYVKSEKDLPVEILAPRVAGTYETTIVELKNDAASQSVNVYKEYEEAEDKKYPIERLCRETFFGLYSKENYQNKHVLIPKGTLLSIHQPTPQDAGSGIFTIKIPYVGQFELKELEAPAEYARAESLTIGSLSLTEETTATISRIPSILLIKNKLNRIASRMIPESKTNSENENKVNDPEKPLLKPATTQKVENPPSTSFEPNRVNTLESKEFVMAQSFLKRDYSDLIKPEEIIIPKVAKNHPSLPVTGENRAETYLYICLASLLATAFYCLRKIF